MSELALFIVRLGFVAALWIFVFSIISVIRTDLFGQKVVNRAARANAPQVVSAPISNSAPVVGSSTLLGNPTGNTATKLVIIEGAKAGQMVRLERREITIGRSPDSDLIVDDEYASTHHAKLILVNNDWLIQDLNSTNGTYLDRSRVGTPAVVKLNTPVRVGETVFELRS